MLTPEFNNVLTLNLYLNDFKDVASDAVAAMVEERAVFISTCNKFHQLADDCLLVAMHWTDIVSAVTWVGDKKMASDLCQHIVARKPLDDSGKKT